MKQLWEICVGEERYFYMKKKKRYHILMFLCTVLLLFQTPVAAQQPYDLETSTAEEDTPDGGMKPIEAIQIDESYGLYGGQQISVYTEDDSTSYVSAVNRSNWDDYGDDYCYNRLSAEKQELYDQMNAFCTQYMNTLAYGKQLTVNGSTVYGIGPISYSGLTTSELSSLVYIFTYQNPQFYFLANGLYYNSSIVYLKIYDDFADGDTRSDVSKQMFDSIDTWVQKVAAEKTQLAKEQMAHDIVCEQVVYSSGTYDQSAYSAVIEGKTVCAGYTKLYSMLTNAAGLQTVSVTSATHGWNRTKIGSRWYNVDTTWDDGTIVSYDYFNKSDATMKRYDGTSRESHTQNTYYDGIAPECLIDYDPTLPSIDAPGAVANLKAQPAGKNKVLLTWDIADADAKYLIYAVKEGTYGYCGMTGSNRFVDTKACDGEYNFYWVFPYRTDEDGVNVVGPCPAYVYAKGVCLAVTNQKAYSQTGSVRLIWTKSVGADGYLIYGKTATGAYHYIGMSSTTTITDKKAASNEYNFYWIFPYHKDSSGKMIAGLASNPYVYGIAR